MRCSFFFSDGRRDEYGVKSFLCHHLLIVLVDSYSLGQECLSCRGQVTLFLTNRRDICARDRISDPGIEYAHLSQADDADFDRVVQSRPLS